jgi:hypothetical protein
MFLAFVYGKAKANGPFLISSAIQNAKAKKILLMLEIAQFVKSGFLHFGNTKTKVDFFFAKTFLN